MVELAIRQLLRPEPTIIAVIPVDDAAHVFDEAAEEEGRDHRRAFSTVLLVFIVGKQRRCFGLVRRRMTVGDFK